MIEVLDRVPRYPNRKKITPENGTSYFATVEYADDPIIEGTHVNKSLFDAIQKYAWDIGDIKQSVRDLEQEQTEEYLLCDGRTITTSAYPDISILAKYGSSWTNISDLNTSFNDVKYLNNIFIAVGNIGDCFTSLDGIVWTEQSGLSGNSNNTSSVTYGNGLYVAVGGYTQSSLRYGRYYTSSDGVTWSKTNLGSNYLNSVTYGNGRFVAVGNSGACYTSTSGTSWTSVSGLSGTLNSVAYGNGRFVAVGESNACYTSTSGTSWTSVSGLSGALNSVTYGGGRFVIVGDSGACYTSTSGTSWTSVSGLSGTLNSVAYGDDVYMIVGTGTTVYTSTNGTSWTRIEKPSSTSNGVSYGKGYFVTVGSISTANYRTSKENYTLPVIPSVSDCNYYIRVKGIT